MHDVHCYSCSTSMEANGTYAVWTHTDRIFYKDIAKDVETKFDTSGYLKDDNRPPITGKNKKVIGMIKDELGGKIMRKCVALRQKICNAYRKTEKYKKMCVAAVGLTFDKYKVSLTNPPNWRI